MGWTTEFVILKSIKEKPTLTWKAFNDKVIRVFEFNKTNLLSNYYYKQDFIKNCYVLDSEIDGSWSGYLYANLTKETIIKLLKKENVENLLDYYNNNCYKFKSKKDRDWRKREYTNALKACLHILNNNIFAHVIIVQG